MIQNKRGAIELSLTLIISLIIGLLVLFAGYYLSNQGGNLITKLKQVGDSQVIDVDTNAAAKDPELAFEKAKEFFYKGIDNNDNTAFINSRNFFNAFFELIEEEENLDYSDYENLAEYYLGIISYYLSDPDMIKDLEANTGEMREEKFGAYSRFYEPISRVYLILAYDKVNDFSNVIVVYKKGDINTDFITFLNNLETDNKPKEYNQAIHLKVTQTIAKAYLKTNGNNNAKKFYDIHKSDIDKDPKLKTQYQKLSGVT